MSDEVTEAVRPYTDAEVEAIRIRMDIWGDYGPDPTETILRLIATIEEARSKSLASASLRKSFEKTTGTGRWGSWGMQLRVSTCPERCSDYDHSQEVAYFLTEVDGRPRTFDLDFAVAAMNAVAIALGKAKP